MKISITIRDNQSGEVAVYHDPHEWSGWDDERDVFYQIDWMFGEGNYGCDCNRVLFFVAGKTGRYPELKEAEIACGKDRYTILKIENAATGERVYADG
jgi:hypothetical protein